MRDRFLLLFAFSFLVSTSFAQPDSPWKDWLWLLGEWEGAGSGQPG